VMCTSAGFARGRNELTFLREVFEQSLLGGEGQDDSTIR